MRHRSCEINDADRKQNCIVEKELTSRKCQFGRMYVPATRKFAYNTFSSAGETGQIYVVLNAL